MDAKRILQWGILAVLMFSPTYLQAEDNLLANGNMETWQSVEFRGFAPDGNGMLPAGWTAKQDNPEEAGTGSITQDFDQKHEGGSSLRLENRSAEQSLTLIHDLIEVTPGQTYVLSGYIRGENISQPANKEQGILFFLNQGPEVEFAANSKTKLERSQFYGGFDWEFFEFPVTIEGEANRLRIAVQLRRIEGVVWLDALKLTPQN